MENYDNENSSQNSGTGYNEQNVQQGRTQGAQNDDQTIYNDPSFNNIGQGYYTSQNNNKTNYQNGQNFNYNNGNQGNQNGQNFNGNQGYQNGQNFNSNQGYQNGQNFNGNQGYQNGQNFNGNPGYNGQNYNHQGYQNNGAPQYQQNNGNFPSFNTYLILSIVVAVLGSRILGIISIVLTVFSNNDYKDGNMAGYDDKIKITKVLLIVGAVFFAFKVLNFSIFHIFNIFNIFNYL